MSRTRCAGTTITLDAGRTNAAAPQTLAQSARRRRTPTSGCSRFGAAYAATGSLTVYGGINYGRSPVPPRNLTPLIAAIGETPSLSRRLRAGSLAPGSFGGAVRWST